MTMLASDGESVRDAQKSAARADMVKAAAAAALSSAPVAEVWESLVAIAEPSGLGAADVGAAAVSGWELAAALALVGDGSGAEAHALMAFAEAMSLQPAEIDRRGACGRVARAAIVGDLLGSRSRRISWAAKGATTRVFRRASRGVSVVRRGYKC